MTRWFQETFLQSIFQRAGTNKGLWLSQRQTAVCVDNMTRHSVRDRDKLGDMCSRLYYDCRWNGREVMMQYSKLNGCGMIFFGLNDAEKQAQERKNQIERETHEIRRLLRRFERHPDKFNDDLQALMEEIADTESDFEEDMKDGLDDRYVKSYQSSLAEMRKTLAWMLEIKNTSPPGGLKPGERESMVYIDVKPGDDFSLCGQLLRYVRADGDEIVLYDIRKKKTFIHGFDALQRTVKQFGYRIIK